MQQVRPLDLQPGDILGFSGSGYTSCFINAVTYGLPNWPFIPKSLVGLSHVGILAEYDGRLLLFESCDYDSNPCVITGRNICGTQAHEIESTVANYEGNVWHYPLYRELYDYESKRLSKFLVDTIGKPYDHIGAFRSGGCGYSWIESKLRDADLSSIFCSEWCLAALTTIGLIQTDHVSRLSPNRFSRLLRRLRISLKPRRMK